MRKCICLCCPQSTELLSAAGHGYKDLYSECMAASSATTTSGNWWYSRNCSRCVCWRRTCGLSTGFAAGWFPLWTTTWDSTGT
ncbi:hypothetical protein JOB18_004963 [Solea senegalensis]|uniref:Secreted protein n=1 Tax=Solea senegalensis TaxID=28829 RepID=A0AAV6PNJ7_SOLSE|nr:hypothetical protein JOB18_004963 [Solea senegalensis]